MTARRFLGVVRLMPNESLLPSMEPCISGDRVVIEDRATASTLINKGSYGEPQKGGGLQLSLVEAAYLMEEGRITVRRSKKGRSASLSELIIRGIDRDPGFLGNLMVYRDLRNRAMVVKGQGYGTWTVFPRGKRPATGKADTWVRVYREHDMVTARELWLEARSRQNMRLKSLASVVDSDWDVTHYLVSPALEEAERSEMAPVRREELSVARMPVEGGGAFISGENAIGIGEKYSLGTKLSGSLLLSPEEDRMLFAGEADKDRAFVFEDLRARGCLVKTGFKYGSHFRVYPGMSIDEHSLFLVHCITGDEPMTWEELSRPIRLSHSVRKRFLFAMPAKGIGAPHHEGDGPLYLELKWTRP
ncbi:MAG: tRNA-intron lyase [Thermoplasmatota archaeon]